MTSSPSFGLVLPSSSGGDVPEPDSIWKVVDEAERSSLEYLWVSDHIVWWHAMYESLTLVAAIAARTSRVRIGTAVLLLAMRDPVIAAKTIASIERISHGRLTLGVGIGGEFPPEWQAVGVEVRSRASRTEEMIEAIRGLWGGAFGFEGKRIRFDPIDLHPKPSSSPPIWIGGRSDAAVRRAARLGDGWMGLFLTPDMYEKKTALLRSEIESQGKDPTAFSTSVYVWTCIADSNAEAKRIASDLVGGFYNLPFERLEKYVIAGSPEACAERFAEFARAGVDHFAVAPIAAPGTEFVKRLTTEVVPAVNR